MKDWKHTFQMVSTYILLFVGVALLFIGCFCPPVGEIHNSVLIAFGEILTFIGAVMGIDFHYRYKEKE